MNKSTGWYIVLFVVCVLIQVLFMSKIQFSAYVNPYFYILFIFLLPLSVPKYLLLLLGFLLGFVIDIFSNTPGIHASSTVFLAYIRPFVIGSSLVDESERYMIPSLFNLGFAWFFRYSLLLTALHHFFLFSVEVFSFHGFFDTLLRSLASTLFSFVFILMSQFFIFRK